MVTMNLSPNHRLTQTPIQDFKANTRPSVLICLHPCPSVVNKTPQDLNTEFHIHQQKTYKSFRINCKTGQINIV